MKHLLLLVVAACIAMTTNARNYYFSTASGDDSRSAEQAQNPSTPWKTLDKLNAFFSNIQPGDSILFNRGESFYGSFNITKSGNAGAPIVISAYGTGARPDFTGFSTANNWNSLGNNIWESSFSGVEGLNTVLIDNSLRALGRFPNANTSNGGHLTLESHNGKTTITDNELTSAVNWTGAEIVIRKNQWILDRAKITAHSGNTIAYDNTSGYEPLDWYGYFIQNDPRTLDQDGEWYYNSAQHLLRIYSTTNPSSRTIKASSIDNIVTLSAHDYVTFDNIQISGANQIAIKLEYANHITIQNSDVVYSGTFGIKAFITDYLTIENSNVNHSFSNAIYAAPFCSHSIFRKNTVHNIGLAAGMGNSNNQTYEGLVVHGSYNMVEKNKFDSIGYVAVRFYGDYTTVQHNFIKNFALTKDDGGGIYTNGDIEFFEQKVIDNVILNGRGNASGTNSTIASGATGIYMDDRSANVEILRNTIANCSENGIYLHNSHEIDVKNNTLFNNRTQSAMVHDVLEPGDPIRNIKMYKNVLFSLGSTQIISNLESTQNDIGQFGSFDSNYYCRPVNEGLIVKTKAVGVEQTYDLPGWKSTYNMDHNGQTTPMEIPAFTSKITGTNLFANGTFNSNVNGVSAFAIPANLSTTWVNEGNLDGGSLKASYNTSNGATNADIIFNIGSIVAGKTYILNFSMIGVNNSDMYVFLRNNGGSYNNLGEVMSFKNTTSRTEQEFLFHATASSNSATLVFTVNGADCPLYLDNVSLYEAQVSMNNPEEYVRFEYNETESPKTIALDGNYIDVAKNQFANSITLQPFTSAILLKEEQSMLPLKFVQFKGNKINQNVDLIWVTANEINTSHFEIERSANAADFAKIGTIASTNVAAGTSNYKFTDHNPLLQNNYYRLKQIDKDGKSTYSNIALIAFAGDTKMTVSPNPATDKVRVSISTSQTNQKATLSIHALSGVTVKTMPVVLSNESISVDVSALASGVYVVHVSGDGLNFNQRFVKQ